MQRRKLNRGERPGRSLASVLALREGRLVCRYCRQPCQARNALNAGRGVLRCPRCGGRLDRSNTGDAHATDAP